MKFYLQAFLKSFYDLEWLRGQKKNGKQSATYVVLLILLLSVVFSIFAMFQLNRLGDQFKNKIMTQIPDVELQVEGGLLTVSGVEQPYTYLFEDDTDESFLLYVDTVTTSSLSIEDLDIEEGQSVMLVTQTDFSVFEVDQGRTQKNSFSELPDTSLTKAEIEAWYEGVLNRKFTIFTIILVATFLLLGIGKMIYLLLLALIVNLIQKIAKKEYGFGELFTMGLFAITGPSIVVMALRMFGYGVPYLYTLLVLAYLLTAVFYNKKSEPPKSIDKVE